eukprot:1660436-Amphidinium_carterae.2
MPWRASGRDAQPLQLGIRHSDAICRPLPPQLEVQGESTLIGVEETVRHRQRGTAERSKESNFGTSRL